MTGLDTKKEIKLAELAINDIKALIYDQIIVLEQAKNNIQTLERELTKRIQAQKT
jgi:hypothetical protein